MARLLQRNATRRSELSVKNGRVTLVIAVPTLARANAPELPVSEVASGIFVHAGSIALMSPDGHVFRNESDVEKPGMLLAHLSPLGRGQFAQQIG
jgi:hypothetical protein